MKWLKKFEELDPGTYRNAGYKLQSLGKSIKGGNLVDYGNEKEFGLYNMWITKGAANVREDAPFGIGSVYGKVPYTFIESYTSFNFFVRGSKNNMPFLHKDAESLVKSWADGNCTLGFTIEFSFKPSEKTKSVVDIPGYSIPLFGIRVDISSYGQGIDNYNEYRKQESENEYYDEHEGEWDKKDLDNYVEFKPIDMFGFYENTKQFKISLCPPIRSNKFSGLFSDRKSAIKFKKTLPNILEKYHDKIFDILSIVGADSSDIDDLKKSFTNIWVNALYDDENAPNNQSRQITWFNGNKISN